jgi:PhnB protein
LNDPQRAGEIFANLAQDGSVEMPLQKTYWAEAFGILTDRYGVRWMVNCDAPK